jgi:hypothetical protein
LEPSPFFTAEYLPRILKSSDYPATAIFTDEVPIAADEYCARYTPDWDGRPKPPTEVTRELFGGLSP